MRKLKKIISLILVLTALLSLSGCTSGKVDYEGEEDSKTKPSIKDSPAEESDDEASQKKPSVTVIAKENIAAIINDQEVSSVQMNYYFTDYIQDTCSTLQSQYGDSTATMIGLMGIDVNLPLNEQYYDQQETQTLADHYLKAAASKAKSDYALYSKAIAEGFKLSEDEQAALTSNLEMLDLYAQLYGYKDADKYLQALYGSGSDLKSYREYCTICTVANAFYTKYNTDLTYDDAAIRAYEKANQSQYDAFSTAPLANVRHLLVVFEGGTTNADGTKTYSQAEMDAAKAEAEKLLKQWKDGEQTEKSFIALVQEHTDDTASKETGGLYEDIHPNSNYVPNFLAWAIDPNRQVGDIGIIATEYGYHIMYFASFGQLTCRDYMIREDMREDDTEAWYNAIVEGATAEIKSTKYLNMDISFASFITE